MASLNLVFKGCVKKENDIFREIQFLAFEWLRCRSKGGKTICWDSWVCNPANAVRSCILAPR